MLPRPPGSEPARRSRRRCSHRDIVVVPMAAATPSSVVRACSRPHRRAAHRPALHAVVLALSCSAVIGSSIPRQQRGSIRADGSLGRRHGVPRAYCAPRRCVERCGHPMEHALLRLGAPTPPLTRWGWRVHDEAATCGDYDDDLELVSVTQ